MTGRYLTEMADVLRAAGLHVEEVDGWETRARSSGGYAEGRPWVVMWHHTASQASPDSDIAYIVGADTAPISNLYLDRTGCIHVIAAGATNTNGKGGPQSFTRGTVPLDKMNEYAVSIEAANSGLGEPWPCEQIDAFFAASIALTNWLGLSPSDISSHAGWTTRKIDPATAAAVQGPWKPRSVNTSGTWSLDDLRHEATRRATTAPSPTPPTEEDDMTAATLWRPKGYVNTFLIGAGSTMHVSEAVYTSLTARGVPVVVEMHPQMLETCLFQTGLTEADLVPGGG
jgi:hypothetical protein